MSSIWTVRRSATDYKIGGLCGGIAERWGVDPVLVRVGAVLLGLSGGIGVVLYVAGWLMIPIAGQTRTHLDDTFPRLADWPREFKVALVAVACVLIGVLLAPVLPFGFGSALILAAIWYFGYYRHRPDGRTSALLPPVGATGQQLGDQSSESYQYFTFTGPSTPFTEAAQSWQRRMQDYEQGRVSSADPRPDDRQAYLASADPVGLYRPPTAASTAAPTPPSTGMQTGTAVARPAHRGATLAARRLRLASLLVVGLAMGGLVVAADFGAHLGPAVYFATALLIAGLTLIVAAWFGRARGILPVALLLAVATVVSGIFGPGVSAVGADRPSIGVRQVSFASATDLPAAETLDSGRLTVDLSRLTLTESRTFTTHVHQGSLTLIAPADSRVEVVSSVDDGYLRIDGQSGRWGSELQADTDYPGPAGSASNGPVLTVQASVDQGVLEVRR